MTNLKVFSYNPHKTKEELSSMGFYKIDTLEKLFSEMDIVSVNVPLTAETKDMINKKIFDVANPHLLLVNTSRRAKKIPYSLSTTSLQHFILQVQQKNPCVEWV